MKKQIIIPLSFCFSICILLACGTSSSLTSNEKIIDQGYGTQKESNRTTAISQLDLDKEPNAASVSWMELFQRVPGLTVNGSGTNLSIQIRGKKSMTASHEPLFVVNNQIIGNGFHRVNFLEPAMVKRISVLKDAGSAAAYGTRGADGVILITLKK